VPVTLGEDDLEDNVRAAQDTIQEEADRSRAGANLTRDPAGASGAVTTPGAVSNMEALKLKFPFLLDYTDQFIKDTGVTALIKMETASRKIQDLDRNKKAEDKLFNNREALANMTSVVESGVDNRLDVLHAARCLPGATCSAGKLWLHARSIMGNKGHAPLSTYDMASIGLGGSVSAKGWVALHDPSNPNISIKMFSMSNCVTSSKKGQDEQEYLDLADMAEFKTALRVLRGAMVYVHPWNRSVDALESFFIQSNFGASDLATLDKPAIYLSQFTDYVLVENSSRWRGMEPFLTTRDLRATWEDFVCQKSSAIAGSRKVQGRSQQGGLQGATLYNQQQGSQLPSTKLNMPINLFFDDICVMWNLGKCVKAPGVCQTRKGKLLKHICNYRPNPARPDLPCAMNHACYAYHK